MGGMTTPSAEAWQVATENEALVVWCLQRMRVPAHRWDDAFQDGMIGLAVAAEKLDPAKGTLGTYAPYWIRQHVNHGREVEEGINYRRAHASGRKVKGATYEPPLSLDMPMTDEGFDLYMVTPSGDDPAQAATDLTLAQSVAARLERLCRDDIDRAALRCLSHGGWEAAAAELGTFRQTVAYRAKRLAKYARQILQEAA